jgi:hypothetical protein
MVAFESALADRWTRATLSGYRAIGVVEDLISIEQLPTASAVETHAEVVMLLSRVQI